MKRLEFNLVSPRKRPVIKLNGIDVLMDSGAELSLSIFSKKYFERHYNIVGEKHIESIKTANSEMPGTVIILEKFQIGELTIVGLPILIPDGETYIKTPIALGADVFYNCGLDHGALNSKQKYFIEIPDDIMVRKYSLT